MLFRVAARVRRRGGWRSAHKKRAITGFGRFGVRKISCMPGAPRERSSRGANRRAAAPTPHQPRTASGDDAARARSSGGLVALGLVPERVELCGREVVHVAA